jgi:hypothetical protein
VGSKAKRSGAHGERPNPPYVSKVEPGVDAIIATQLISQPDFDHPEELKTLIEATTLAFIKDIRRFVIK